MIEEKHLEKYYGSDGTVTKALDYPRLIVPVRVISFSTVSPLTA